MSTFMHSDDHEIRMSRHWEINDDRYMITQRMNDARIDRSQWKRMDTWCKMRGWMHNHVYYLALMYEVQQKRSPAARLVKMRMNNSELWNSVSCQWHCHHRNESNKLFNHDNMCIDIGATYDNGCQGYDTYRHDARRGDRMRMKRRRRKEEVALINTTPPTINNMINAPSQHEEHMCGSLIHALTKI